MPQFNVISYGSATAQPCQKAQWKMLFAQDSRVPVYALSQTYMYLCQVHAHTFLLFKNAFQTNKMVVITAQSSRGKILFCLLKTNARQYPVLHLCNKDCHIQMLGTVDTSHSSG